MAAMPPFPLEVLSEWLRYDAETGFLWWRKKPTNNAKMNQPVGAVIKAGYVKFHIRNSQIYAHHAAWFLSRGEWPIEQIDHVNGNRSDNRACNLRLATQAQQNFNTGLHITNTSGAKGVSWDRRVGRWRAYITLGKKQRHLGSFASFDAARDARRAAETMVCGEFLRRDSQEAST